VLELEVVDVVNQRTALVSRVPRRLPPACAPFTT
jgi:hypothetical protein